MENEKEDIRRDIIEASKSIFKKDGYNKVTMDDIAKAALKGRSSLYHYFKNKHEIFEAMVIDEFLIIHHKAKSKISAELSFEDNLKKYSEAKLNGLKLLTKKYTYILRDLKGNHILLYKLQSQMSSLEINVFKHLLSSGVKNGDIKRMDNNDIDYLALAIVTAIGGLEKELILFEKIEDATSRSFWLINILVKGLQ